MSRRLTPTSSSVQDHIDWLNKGALSRINPVPVSNKIVDSSRPVVTLPDSSDVSLPLVSRQSREIVPYNPVYVPSVSSLGYFETAALHLCKLVASKLPFPPAASLDLCLLAARELSLLGQSVTPKNILAKAKSLFKSNPKLVSGKSVPSSGRVISVTQGIPPSGNFSSVKQTSTMAKNFRSSRNSTTVRNAPVARSVRVSGTNRPRMSTNRGNIVVSHREMIGSLISSPTTLQYSATSFVLNPGKASTFPWMSTMAQNYDKYVLRSFEVQLVSNQPTSTAGRIGVGIDYDSTDPLPADRVEFFNLTHHVEGAPWDTLTFKFPLDNKPRFVNSHTTTDSKLIDCGQLVFVSDQVVATSTSLADIIVSYSVELLEAQQAPLSTMYVSGFNAVSFAAMSVVGPVVATQIPTTSTAVVEYSLPAGCYELVTLVNESLAGSPNTSVTIHGGTGWTISLGTTTNINSTSVFKITTNDGKIKITSAKTIDTLESYRFFFTRLSPAVFVALNTDAAVVPAPFGALTVY